ncbi:MAG: hypothetical protein F4Y44_09435 [Chloroflexi bacterium]|nr:hypothetical protein [Chloroflexota bacterium]
MNLRLRPNLPRRLHPNSNQVGFTAGVVDVLSDAGGGMSSLVDAPDYIRRVVTRKIAQGLLSK